MDRKQDNVVKPDDLEAAGKAVEYMRTLRRRPLAGEAAGDAGRHAGAGEIEGMLRKLRPVVEMDREAARLYARIGRLRRRRTLRRVAYAAGTAAAVALLLLCVSRLVRTPGLPGGGPGPLHLSEIKVPTLITASGDDVLDVETLDLRGKDPVYIAGPLAEEKDGVAADILPPVYYRRVVLPAGYTYSVMLADGSKVTLNAGSELKFPLDFRDSVRRVELSGEAYFEVAKSRLPFVVQAGDAEVRVYGTRFNLFYSRELAVAEAVLVEGSIGMTVDSTEIRMLPCQRLVCDLDARHSELETVDPALYVGWMGKTFKYDGVRLDRIVSDISKWYGIGIRLDAEMSAETFSMEFDKSASKEWVFGMLEKITGKSVMEEGGDYYLR